MPHKRSCGKIRQGYSQYWVAEEWSQEFADFQHLHSLVLNHKEQDLLHQLIFNLSTAQKNLLQIKP